MRIVKEHDERKNEILDTAERLFATKGFDHCTVSEIICEIGIAKGTFYHYFKSKEEVLDAVIERTGNMIAGRVRAVVQDEALSPEDKLLQLFLSMRVTDEMADGFLNEMHKPENALMHQKSMQVILDKVTPVLTAIVEEGIQQGVFQCPYPRQYMLVFLSASNTMLDGGIFELPPEEQQEMFVALIALLENMLGVHDGRLARKAMSEYHLNIP